MKIYKIVHQCIPLEEKKMLFIIKFIKDFKSNSKLKLILLLFKHLKICPLEPSSHDGLMLCLQAKCMTK